MSACETCAEPIPDGWRFCRSCRGFNNGRKGWGKTNQGHTKVCENCGVTFPVPAYRLATARTCSKKCLGAIQSRERKGKFQMGPENPTYKSGIQTYRRHRKTACERCGSTKNLCVHHKDENRYNNELANLETLCKRCHQIHHKAGQHLPKGPRGPRTRFPQACERCGVMFTRNSTSQRYCSRQCWLAIKNARAAA